VIDLYTSNEVERVRLASSMDELKVLP